MTTPLLEQYPATANPLPVAWDGAPVVWGPWQVEPVYVCAGSRSRAQAQACSACGSSAGSPLAIRGRVDVGGATHGLRLTRCPTCALDTVVDGELVVWTLGEEDYGPEGSWFELEQT